jgi:hypothetical protein
MRHLIAAIAITAACLSFAAPTIAEPSGKPAFLQQDNNTDVAYCFVVLRDGKYRTNPKDLNLTLRYLSRAAYLWTILEERAGEKWPAIRDEVVQWTAKAIEEDLATQGSLRLSPQACLDLAVREDQRNSE